jgi:hypothetical protein
MRMDVEPGSFPNPINLASGGTLPVAILSTASIDASRIDIGTVRMAGAPVGRRPNGTGMAAFEDVDSDDRLDVVCTRGNQ